MMHIEPLTITLKCKEGSDQEKIGNYIHVHISCCAQPTLFSKMDPAARKEFSVV